MKPSPIFLIIIVVVLFVFQSNGQYDPKAEEILKQVSKKYEAFTAYKANFIYELENQQAKVNERFSGEILVKGQKYNIKLGNQEIYNNGSTVWTFLVEENEVNITDYSPGEDEITPTNIYNMYKKGYKYLLLEEEKIKGVAFNVLDLVPENKNKSYFKIRLWVNKKDYSILKWKIFEKNGNRYEYAVSNFVPNVKVEDNVFSFDKNKYKGVEVIDLR